MDRRHFIGQGAAAIGLLAGFSGQAHANLQKAEILVIGGGYGGATVAKFLRLFSNNTAKVTFIEPNTSFIAYRTLVPISPYTTPMAPSVSAERDDLDAADTN